MEPKANPLFMGNPHHAQRCPLCRQESVYIHRVEDDTIFYACYNQHCRYHYKKILGEEPVRHTGSLGFTVAMCIILLTLFFVLP